MRTAHPPWYELFCGNTSGSQSESTTRRRRIGSVALSSVLACDGSMDAAPRSREKKLSQREQRELDKKKFEEFLANLPDERKRKVRAPLAKDGGLK